MRWVVALALLSGTASADERMSESLTDCAAVVALPNVLTPGLAGTPDGASAAALSDRFRAAAVREAASEGRDDADDFVEKMLRLKEASLVPLGAGFVDQQDYRDRVAFCRAIGADRGVAAGS